MDKAMKLAAVLLLFCCVPAVAESPLAEMEWLIGGQWESKAALPAGHVIESRIVVEYGPGKWSMRMRYYVKAKQGEYQQYETFFWAAPKKPHVQYITFSTQGAVIRGEGEIKDGVMTLQQPATRLYPEMRSIYRRDAEDKDRYVGENFWNQKGGWKKVMTATCVRKELSNPPKLKVAERRGKLAAFEPFTRGDFVYSVKGDKAAVGRGRSRFSLHGRLIVGWDFALRDGKSVPYSTSVAWADPKSGAIKRILVDARGAVSTSTIGVEVGRMTSEWTETPRSGEATIGRTAIVWTDTDTHEARLFSKDGDEWKPLPGVFVGKREKK